MNARKRYAVVTPKLHPPRAAGRIVLLACGRDAPRLDLALNRQLVDEGVAIVRCGGRGRLPDGAALDGAILTALSFLPAVELGGRPERPLVPCRLPDGIPLVLAPGGLDLLRAPPAARKSPASERYAGSRPLDEGEATRVGEALAVRIAAEARPIALCLPLAGLSHGDRHSSPARERTRLELLGALTRRLRHDALLFDCNVHIEDPAFARLCFEALLALWQRAERL